MVQIQNGAATVKNSMELLPKRKREREREKEGGRERGGERKEERKERKSYHNHMTQQSHFEVYTHKNKIKISKKDLNSRVH